MGVLDWLRTRRRAARAEGLPQEGSPLLVSGEAALDAEALLEAWRWLVRPEFTPVLCTACGDLFLQGPTGAVFWLDVGTGAFRSAAASAEAFDEKAHDPERFDEWFKPDLVKASQKLLRPLAPGECYSYLVPPGLGGALSAANLSPRPLAEHFATLGQLFASR